MKLAAKLVSIALPAVVLGVVLAVVGCTAPREVAVPAYQPPERKAATDLKYVPVGMSGCQASACHGAPARDLLAGKIDATAWQSSGSCWAAADPHSAAYSLLTDRPHRPVKVTARHVMDRYAPGTEATDDARCVACHTNPTLASEKLFGDPHAKALRAEGVSCEACHGNAGGWVSDHTTWKGDRKEVYAKTGMTPLYDLGERAMNCVGCHVGAPADKERGLPVRDMNHDMIAAGHPRLNFDFAEYLRRLPVHWQEKNRATDPPTPLALNPAKAWYVGRIAHAEAACRLLADRAERSKTDERTPWPEFAEFNCAACHHNLRAATDPSAEAQWRKDPKKLGRLIGVTPWQTIWPMTDAPGIGDQPRGRMTLNSASRLNEVVWVMSVSRPKRDEASVTARKFAEEMRKLRYQFVAERPKAIENYVSGLLPPDPPLVPEWDSAAQLFFGYAALERARPGPSELVPEFRKALAALRTDDWPRVKWAEVNEAFEAIRRKRP